MDKQTLHRGANATTTGWASLIGSFIEWYDFFVFGIASALVFGPLFFPSFSPTAGTLLSFATFATAWVARPIGGVIFGHFGDRIGRKRVLLVTLLLMGAATVSVGLLPSYESIGIWAPILLVVAWVVQGLSAGGEWAGAAIMAVEHAPPNQKGKYGSFPQLGIPLALVASNGISLFFYQRSSQALIEYGWRIPFLLSLIIVPLGLYIRLKVLESPEFTVIEQRSQIRSVPLATVLSQHWRAVLTIIFVMGGTNAFFFTFTTYSLSYATTQGGLTRGTALTAVIVASCVHTVGTLAFGSLSDRIGRRRMYVIGLSFLAASVFPLFIAIDQHSAALYILALSIAFGLGHSYVWALGAAYFTELFPANVRYTGSSLGYQLSGMIFGGPLPLLAAILVTADAGRPWYIAGFVAALALLGAFVAFIGPDEQQSSSSVNAISPPVEKAPT